MYAAFLWTINNFPVYAYLPGWRTKGALACLSCHKKICSLTLKKMVTSYVIWDMVAFCQKIIPSKSIKIHLMVKGRIV